MACSLYNNGGYGCGSCVHFVKSTSISLIDTNIVVTIPSQTLYNREKICIALAQNIPDTATADTPVVIAVEGITDTFPLYTRCGNQVYGDQLNSRNVLHTIALTDVPAFKMLDNSGLCATKHMFAPIFPST